MIGACHGSFCSKHHIYPRETPIKPQIDYVEPRSIRRYDERNRHGLLLLDGTGLGTAVFQPLCRSLEQTFTGRTQEQWSCSD